MRSRHVLFLAFILLTITGLVIYLVKPSLVKGIINKECITLRLPTEYIPISSGPMPRADYITKDIRLCSNKEYLLEDRSYKITFTGNEKTPFTVKEGKWVDGVRTHDYIEIPIEDLLLRHEQVCMEATPTDLTDTNIQYCLHKRSQDLYELIIWNLPTMIW